MDDCERRKDSRGHFGKESKMKNQQHRVISKGITLGKVVVQLTKKENNCFRLQYNSVVTSKKFIEWDD